MRRADGIDAARLARLVMRNEVEKGFHDSPVMAVTGTLLRSRSSAYGLSDAARSAIPPPERGRSAAPDLVGGSRVGVTPRLRQSSKVSAECRTPTRQHLPRRKAGANAVDLPLSGGGRETVFRANSVAMIPSRLAWFCCCCVLRREREQERGDARERDGDELEPARQGADRDKGDDRGHQRGARIGER